MPYNCYDAMTPNPHGIPGTDTVLIYAGGDTPHVWTAPEIAEQPERYRLPCYVRDNPGDAHAAQLDAYVMLLWLQANAVPKGVMTTLDLEGAVAPLYVATYGDSIHQGGYKVMPYGEGHSLFSNPEIDGYFLSQPGPPAIDARCVATQYGFYGSYDLSLISDAVELWDTAPTPPRVWGGNTSLITGGVLIEGQSIASPSGRYGAIMQTDGNFVVYDGSKPIFATGKNNYYGASRIELQQDGNLVQYLWNNHPLWSTGTSFAGGTYLTMQDDGNLVLYTAGSKALWSSKGGKV